MPRYIDADALIEMLSKKAKTDYEMGLYNHGSLTDSFIRFVERQPTVDAVAVVRCKNCKHFVSGVCRQDLAMNICRGDDFCSYGERREQ